MLPTCSKCEAKASHAVYPEAVLELGDLVIREQAAPAIWYCEAHCPEDEKDQLIKLVELKKS